MTGRTTVRLPQELLDRAKRKAAADGRTLTSLIEDGLRLVVAPERRVRPARRMPRVSKAGGGLLPGVDLAAGSEEQDAEDRDYVRRMRHGR
jgi:hypothetical protein